MRLVYLTFISSSLLGKQVLIKSNESDWTITWPLGILAAGSIGLGYLGKEVILSGGIDPIVPGYVQIMPLLLSLLGAIMAYGFYTWVHMN
jgi:NADH:ubiquinone oxidoreductase subunit 5 (subunit L)/multisubunit Na+/H+ antiporter MnhA subunit